MKQFILFLAFLGIAVFSVAFHKPIHQTEIYIPAVSRFDLKILLVPLDSRPACTQFVVDLAQLAHIQIITPPSELLDNYKTPANAQALRNWLYQMSRNADIAIISTDMLIHGGLLASRVSAGTIDDIQNVLDLLKKIHADNPNVKLYAFSIIPRLLLADNQQNSKYQSDMLKYSILKDQVYTFENPKDLEKLHVTEEKLPAELIQKYLELYKQNTNLNIALMQLVEQNILSQLIIGQDDGQPFGLPNIAKTQLTHYAAQHSALNEKVFITRGTDEVALTLLGRIAAQHSNYHPKIFVEYSDAAGPHIVMPYMPHSVETTVREKIAIAGGQQTTTLSEADYILYVHIGTKNTTRQTLTAAEQTVNRYVQQGYKIALVDLSENFSASETLLPILQQNGFPLPRLIAYAGWNTTSNSVGTAITQATLFAQALPTAKSSDQIFELYRENLEFLTARFLDDWFYLKEVQPAINAELKNSRVDPYNLQDHYQQTSEAISKIIHNRARQLLYTETFHCPISILTEQGEKNIAITALTTTAYLPWQRTFEIYVKPKITLSEIKNN